MKGCICHFAKWQIHPFISKKTISNSDPARSVLIVANYTFFELNDSKIYYVIHDNGAQRDKNFICFSPNFSQVDEHIYWCIILSCKASYCLLALQSRVVKSQQTRRDAAPMSPECRPTVYDARPTLTQHRVRARRFLGYVLAIYIILSSRLLCTLVI